MFPVMTPSDPITSCNTRVGKTHPLDCRHGGQGGTLVSLALASRCRPVRSNDGNHARDHPTYSTLVGKGAFFDFVAIQRIALPDPRLISGSPVAKGQEDRLGGCPRSGWRRNRLDGCEGLETVLTKSGPFDGWHARRIGFESGILIVLRILPVLGSRT
jgi:hypothetical protein